MCLKGCSRFVTRAGVCALLMFVPLARAQNSSVVPLIPAANWHLASSQDVDVNEVSRWGGDGAIEREYGVQSAQYRTYRLEDKLAGALQVAGVVIEQAADTSAAYGLLTYYRAEDMAPEKGMDLTVSGAQGALAVRGKVFLRFFRLAGSHLSADQFRALLILVAGTRPSADGMAGLPAPLPTAGLVSGSEKYLLGLEAARRVLPSFDSDLIGFAEGAEVEVGQYAIGSGKSNPAGATQGGTRATVLAITYPTPQIARERFKLMEKMLGINQERGNESVYGKRSSSFVFLALNSGSKSAATKVLDEFAVSEQVSWDQRYPGRKSVVLQMLELILANLLLLFLLASFAIFGGISIVLSKRLARKWLPDWEWGSEEGKSLITLNLRQ